jgi:lysophospholipase L1-like esterase
MRKSSSAPSAGCGRIDQSRGLVALPRDGSSGGSIVSEVSQTVLPIYIVGDSHALPYRGLMFREKWTGAWALARSCYISGFAAGDFYRPDTGEFQPDLIRFLEFEGLVRDGRATHLSMDATDFAIATAAGQPVKPPLIMVVVGDIDIRAVIMPILADKHDFVPPFETPLPVLDKPLIPWDLVEEAIDRQLSPLIAGLRQLVACGFNRLYVQAVVPPTRNEAAVRRLHGYGCPASVRTKLVDAFNRKLAEFCRPIGVTVLENWAALTQDGLLKPDLELDGVHLPPRAARWYVEMLLEHAINCQWFATNHVRYELFYRMACGLEPVGTTFGAQSTQ